MKKPHRSIFAVTAVTVTAAAILLTGAPSASAALEIKATDVTENAGAFGYTYSLGYADLTAAATAADKDPAGGNVNLQSGKLFDDVFSISANIYQKMEASSGAWTNGYIFANGGTAQSSFTYKFDFTSAGYEITSFTVKDILFSTSANSYWSGMKSVTTQYSLDGTHWTDLRSTTSLTGGSNTFTGGTSSTITLSSGESIVYYRVLFESLNGTTTLGSEQSWNRLNGITGANNANFFEVDFNLAPASIPEPAAMAALLGAGVVGYALIRRFRSRA
ncbi:PEP-CTERM putative exosortase interaction domain-containing protein [Opitutaceae bacterium TAV1]|nr:PEP-CTERM putative exosortase interaction domain-containing protein [Opitutaceae bacterium TAV1]